MTLLSSQSFAIDTAAANRKRTPAGFELRLRNRVWDCKLYSKWNSSKLCACRFTWEYFRMVYYFR